MTTNPSSNSPVTATDAIVGASKFEINRLKLREHVGSAWLVLPDLERRFFELFYFALPEGGRPQTIVDFILDCHLSAGKRLSAEQHSDRKKALCAELGLTPRQYKSIVSGLGMMIRAAELRYATIVDILRDLPLASHDAEEAVNALKTALPNLRANGSQDLEKPQALAAAVKAQPASPAIQLLLDAIEAAARPIDFTVRPKPKSSRDDQRQTVVPSRPELWVENLERQINRCELTQGLLPLASSFGANATVSVRLCEKAEIVLASLRGIISETLIALEAVDPELPAALGKGLALSVAVAPERPDRWSIQWMMSIPVRLPLRLRAYLCKHFKFVGAKNFRFRAPGDAPCRQASEAADPMPMEMTDGSSDLDAAA